MRGPLFTWKCLKAFSSCLQANSDTPLLPPPCFLTPPPSGTITFGSFVGSFGLLPFRLYINKLNLIHFSEPLMRLFLGKTSQVAWKFPEKNYVVLIKKVLSEATLLYEQLVNTRFYSRLHANKESYFLLVGYKESEVYNREDQFKRVPFLVTENDLGSLLVPRSTRLVVGVKTTGFSP